MLRPDEVGKERISEWLAGVPAKCGSSTQAERIDLAVNSPGLTCGGDCAEVFESLGRLEEAIVAAQTDLHIWKFHGPLRVQSHTVVGRCQAKLGRLDEAQASFETAIKDAARCELPYLEMLARRDMIVHVLDAHGRRGEQMEALGGCISSMVLPAAQYQPVLADIDAEAALVAYRGALAAKPKTF